MATSRKEQAHQEFKQISAKIEQNLDQIIEAEDYEKIQALNEENNNVFKKYTDQDEAQKTNEIGYDMNTFKQDTKNAGKILGALHKMTLKGYESRAFKFNWKGVADGMKKLNDLEPHAEMKSLTRKHWLHCANMSFIMTGFPATGYSSTYFHCNKALNSVTAEKVKKEAKNPRDKEAKAKNDAAKKRAEQKITDEADEQADVAEDYDQNDGQISTVVLQKCLDTIAKEIKFSETGQKIEYFRSIISPRSFRFGR